MNDTRVIRKSGADGCWSLRADLCVVGAGMAGISAAIAAAREGKEVILIDANAFLGGQTYNANIGCFGGFYGNGGKDATLLTPIMAKEMFADMADEDGLTELVSDTKVFVYDANVFLRWTEKKMQALGIKILLGAVLFDVRMSDKRIDEISAATVYGVVKITATGYVDASGDCVLGWTAGLACQTAADTTVFGTQMMVLKGVDYSLEPPCTEEINKRALEKKDVYGLKRVSNVVFYLPGCGDLFYGNMTHVETPLDPVQHSLLSMTGKDEVDKVLYFLRTEFPATFGRASIHHYVNTGVRQTRCISSVRQLTIRDMCSGRRFEDSIGRTAWPVELHSTEAAYTWNTFAKDHVHYIPFSCMISPEAENYVAAGRCIDADVSALASVRVMGPCSATGTAAAYALILAGKSSVHAIDIQKLQAYLKDNLGD